MTDDAPFLLDVTRLIWRRWKGRLPTGIDRVCLAYLQHFADRSQAVVQHRFFRRILGRESSRELFTILQEPPGHFRATLPGGALKHLGDLNDDGRGRIYLNIGHTGLDSPGFAEWVGRAHVRPVYLIHDLIPITHPQFCRSGESGRHRARIRTVLETATGVIGNSHATLDELAGFAAAESLPMPPARAAWLGLDPLPAPAKAPASDRPTFVVLGTIEARKNHLMLLHLWSRLVDRLRDAAPRLLIIGQRGWEAEPVFELLDSNERLRGHVVELNHCPDEGLAGHLANARALLFPSLAEGYGLPMIEALNAGTPVIASDLPVFHEIAGEIPTYLHPLDQTAWETAILEYSKPESGTRAAQLERLKGYCAPTWDKHFDEVECWLSSL